MLTTTKPTHEYHTRFEQLERTSARVGPEWLVPIRKAAFARFDLLGFPTTRHEEWKYTNVAPIVNGGFVVADAAAPASPRTLPLDDFTFAEDEGCRLVFIDGQFSPDHSSVGSMPDGVCAGSLADAWHEHSDVVRAFLGRHAAYEDRAFTALNTALMEDGAFVHVPARRVIERPIHILYYSTSPARPTATMPRSLFVVEASSQATLVETYAGAGAAACFTNAATELVAKDNAVVDHYKINREGERTFHVGHLQIHQSRDSTVTSHAITLGGLLVRNEIGVVLDGEGGHCTLNGLYKLAGTQHTDNHLLVDHAKPHCDSREVFKGILDDRSHGVFTGRIIVRKDAQKTDGKQTNQNLLLSDEALADSKPQLEIFADDVKCTHGATIGQVDKEAMFYLRSRGLSEDRARSLLVYGFASECLDRVRIESLRSKLGELMFESLPAGQLLRETP